MIVTQLLTAAAVLGLVAGAALLTATIEWLSWRTARRAGLPVAPAGGLIDWIAGLAGLPHSPSTRGEPPGVAFGFATVTAGAVLPAALLARTATGIDPPAGLGVIALSPLVCALGYAMAADRSLAVEPARHRLTVAARIVAATPAWALLVAIWAHASGSVEAGEAARASLDPLWRGALAVGLVWSGLFALPGAVAEPGLAARPWGGDAREESQTVRVLTGACHYAGLAALCVLSGSAFAGQLGMAGLAAGTAVAAVLAWALRVGATLPRLGPWVRLAPRWLVPVALLAVAVAGLHSRP